MADLLPCPFCGGEAELDTMRGYRAMSSGKLGNAVAVYCSKCSADMSFCREDMPDLTTDDLIYIAREEWNRREARDGLVSLTDDNLRQCVAILKRHFLGWRTPPVELPAESVIYAAVQEIAAAIRKLASEDSRG